MTWSWGLKDQRSRLGLGLGTAIRSVFELTSALELDVVLILASYLASVVYIGTSLV